MPVNPRTGGVWHGASAAPTPTSGNTMEPVGALYLWANDTGTGETLTGFTVDTDGCWGDWATYLTLEEDASTVRVLADCYLSVDAQARFNIPAGALAWLSISHDGYIRGPQTQSANNGNATRNMDLTASLPLYPHAADFTITVRALSATMTPAVPAYGAQWLSTVWAPTPDGFTVPGS